MLYKLRYTALPAAMRYILKAESDARRGVRRKTVLHNIGNCCIYSPISILINTIFLKIEIVKYEKINFFMSYCLYIHKLSIAAHFLTKKYAVAYSGNCLICWLNSCRFGKMPAKKSSW